MLSILITVLIGIVSILYSRGQLREARTIREQNQKFVAEQMMEDNLWAEKQVRAATLLCRVAEMDRLDSFGGFGGRVKIFHVGGSLGMLFGDDVHKHILGQLIEKHDDNTYALRPVETSQLRLKATRDLIDLVLVTFEKFQKDQPREAKDMGL